MSDAVLFLAAVRNAKRQPEETTRFQINPDGITSARVAGCVLHHLHIPLAQTLVDFGKCPGKMTALSQNQIDLGAAMNRAPGAAQQEGV